MKNKNKTHTGAKKRFKLTASGKVKRGHAYAAHLKSKKSPKQRRRLRSSITLVKSDQRNVKRLLGR